MWTWKDEELSPPTRVVWIEIWENDKLSIGDIGHHPHGWCGLKYIATERQKKERKGSPPTRVVWIGDFVNILK